MANNTYPREDRLVYYDPVRLPAKFSDLFEFKEIRDGVIVLVTRLYEDCLYENDWGEFKVKYPISFRINPIKGKELDNNNKIYCNGNVNVFNIFDSHCRLVLGWRPRCIVSLLVPVGEGFSYNQDILEFNYNEDEIENYLKELQIEKYKEEIKAVELKKALRQVAKQRLIEEGVLFDEEHIRPYIPKEVVGFIYMRDGGRCRECGCTKDLQIDHIVPLSKGGSSEPENLQLLCKKCNLKHRNKLE